jgi:hypothetical protein
MAESPTNQGAGSGDGKSTTGGTPPKKIAGKFDSLEDAVEKGYVGLEKAFHETREEIGALKQLLERAMTPVGSPGAGNYSYDPYRRGRSSDDLSELEIDPTELITDPKKVFKAQEEKFRKQLEAERAQLATVSANMVANAAAVLKFQMQNPDLEEHEHLVESFMRQTNPQEPLSKRLQQAGKLTRQYLAKLKGEEGEWRGPGGREPSPEEYVEGVGRSGRTERTSEESAESPSPDDELAAEIASRRQWKAKRFSPPSTGQK